MQECADKHAAEALFVSRFIVRQRRDRVLHELLHPRKRCRCIWDITAVGNDRLAPQRIHELPQSVAPETVMAMLRVRGCLEDDPVYVLCGGEIFDARTMPLHEALACLWPYPPFVILHKASGTALTAGESGGYAPWLALLY
ncbi:MAG: hypothetical protein IJZ74_12025 [Clostridia bacterium]|nr:hypothetical protein [Clostridia bacterium]